MIHPPQVLRMVGAKLEKHKAASVFVRGNQVKVHSSGSDAITRRVRDGWTLVGVYSTLPAVSRLEMDLRAGVGA